MKENAIRRPAGETECAQDKALPPTGGLAAGDREEDDAELQACLSRARGMGAGLGDPLCSAIELLWRRIQHIERRPT